MDFGGSFANIARILRGEKEQFSGCGFLATQGHVVTSTMAWGYLGPEDYRSENSLDLPLLAQVQSLRGSVVAWFPADTKEHEADHQLRDIAIVALDEPIPGPLSFPSFADPQKSIGEEVQIFGMDDEKPAEIMVIGRLRETTRSGRLVLNIDKPIPPGPGFLGAPVFSSGGLLGIVVSADEKTATAISATGLSEAMARLTETHPEAGPEQEAEFEPVPESESESEPEPPPNPDPLIDRLMSRRLVVSTLGTDDLVSAQELLDGPPDHWGFGPEIDQGDIVMIYFPKAFSSYKQKGAGRSTLDWGLRFLLRAADASRDAEPSDDFRQVADISEHLELSTPIDPGRFTTPPLSDWGLAKMHFRRAGQQTEPLPADLARALWTMVLKDNPKARERLEVWAADDIVPESNISTHATSDLWTTEDKLGYREYARAIHNFLQDSRTEPPLTISIQAPWGGGKTSLMRMVQLQLDPLGYAQNSGRKTRSLADELKATTETILDELDKLTKREPSEIELDRGKAEGESKCVSIWFNAWRYQSSDQIWAGLAEAVIRGITDRLKPVEREKFLLRLHISRVDPGLIRTKVHDSVFRRFFGIIRWIGPFLFLGVLAVAAFIWNWASVPIGWPVPATMTAVVVSALGAAKAYLTARKEIVAEPAKLNLSDYVDVPNYSEKLGFVHHVTEDLRRVFELLPTVVEDGEKRRLPLVIFIDDLDRCSPHKVAEVFEAINLFIAGEFPNCYIIIGMDTEVVAAALEEAHKSVIDRLPSYARRVPVGWRFMDKFVQLPFVIPPLDDRAVSNYADYLAASEDLDARKVQARAAGDSVRNAEAYIEKSLDDGKDDLEILEGAQEFFMTEPGDRPAKAVDEGRRLAERQIESVKRLRFIDQQAKAFHSDSQKMQALLFASKEEFSNNPRELKRLANVYRFYYNLRLARQAQSQPVPTEPQLQDWLRLSLAWPEVVRWLRRSDTEWESSPDSENESLTATGYRISRFEHFATKPVENFEGSDRKSAKTKDPGVDDWADALTNEFGISKDVPWLRDERLFGFVRKIAERDEGERLSTGSGKGFW